MTTVARSSGGGGPRALARTRRRHALGVARALPIDVTALRGMAGDLNTIGSRPDASG